MTFSVLTEAQSNMLELLERAYNADLNSRYLLITRAGRALTAPKTAA